MKEHANDSQIAPEPDSGQFCSSDLDEACIEMLERKRNMIAGFFFFSPAVFETGTTYHCSVSERHDSADFSAA